MSAPRPLTLAPSRGMLALGPSSRHPLATPSRSSGNTSPTRSATRCTECLQIHYSNEHTYHIYTQSRLANGNATLPPKWRRSICCVEVEEANEELRKVWEELYTGVKVFRETDVLLGDGLVGWRGETVGGVVMGVWVEREGGEDESGNDESEEDESGGDERREVDCEQGQV